MAKSDTKPFREFIKELIRMNPIKAVIITFITKRGSYEFEISKGKKS